jgi:hypothetical protein
MQSYSLFYSADLRASAAAYELFCDKEFRRLAGFERLSQVEQDRIFNELMIAYLALIMLLLEAPISAWSRNCAATSPN